MQTYSDNNRDSYLDEIDYCTNMLNEHKTKYSILCSRKRVPFKKTRLKVLEALIKSDMQEIEIYTKLFSGEINSFEEGLATSTFS